MILEEPALSAGNTQILASKEPVTIQLRNMQRFPLTIWQKPRTQASLRSVAVKITCEEVTNYSDKKQEPIIIASSKVKDQLNLVQEFPNVFCKNIPTKLPPFRVVTQRIDPKPGSKW